MTKEIKLTQGKVALVDDNMFEYLSQWKWYVYKCGNKFYAARNIKISKCKIRLILMHRFITDNKNTKMHTDHINGNGLDNRIINLRICTHSQNSINRGAPINNKTGYKGVSYDKKSNKFKAQIRVNKKNITLLTTNNLIDAARAYNQAAQKYHGEFAKLNILD